MTINDFKLCYFKNNFAYFTSDFENQTGDDWNDAPYNLNAGEPYDYKDTIVFKIAIYGSFSSAQEDQWTTPTSVDEINKGKIPWLVNGWDTEQFWEIKGGITYLEFLKHCELYNINYYVCTKEINETNNKLEQQKEQLQLNFEEQ